MPRIAKALETLRAQVNALAPDRSKKSDGWIGDAKHAARKSDHNPNKKGIVQALDITHDPNNGMDAHMLAETLRKNKDKRLKYVISNARIFSSTQKPWQWRPYAGTNPHTKHVHISVGDLASQYDNPAPWNLGAEIPTPPPPDIEPVAVADVAVKPLVKSKSAWAAIGTVVASVGGALTDWKVAAVLVVGALAAFLIWDRMRNRAHIKGIVR